MRSRWSDDDAREFIARYAGEWGEALALRTYTSRLLGAEPELVLHGGGNTSVKVTRRTLLGETVPGLHVKASGFDLASIEPEGHPGVDLDAPRASSRAPEPERRGDGERAAHAPVESAAATPSIETLVHAFLPAPFVDHTHADAILALTNQAGGDALVARGARQPGAGAAVRQPGVRSRRAGRRHARCASGGERDGAGVTTASSPGATRRARLRDHDRDGRRGRSVSSLRGRDRVRATTRQVEPGTVRERLAEAGASPSRPARLADRRSRSALPAGRPSARCDAATREALEADGGRECAGHPDRSRPTT